MSLNQRGLLILNVCANPSVYSNTKLFETNDVSIKNPKNKYLNWLLLTPYMSVIFAIVFTQSILLLANNQPLNIFLLLLVLVLMPWVSYLLIYVLKLNLPASLNQAHSSSHQSKILLTLIKRLSTQLAFVFALTSWLCIWLNLLVKDIPLGWSSTFDLSAKQLSDVSSVISFAWNDWFESATLSEAWFTQNQFYYLNAGSQIKASQSIQAWRFLLLAVFLYSIFPRLIIFIIHSYQLKTSINAWMKWELPLLQQNSNVQTDFPVIDESIQLNTIEINPQDYDATLSWQMPIEQNNVTLFGVDSWQEDQSNILAIKNNEQLKKILVVVDARQAPIAEISDLITELFEKKQPGNIVLLINTASKHPLRDGQIYSWQNFAKQLGIKSYLTDQF